jgi:hypothetical protein
MVEELTLKGSREDARWSVGAQEPRIRNRIQDRMYWRRGGSKVRNAEERVYSQWSPFADSDSAKGAELGL